MGILQNISNHFAAGFLAGAASGLAAGAASLCAVVTAGAAGFAGGWAEAVGFSDMQNWMIFSYLPSSKEKVDLVPLRCAATAATGWPPAPKV
ncbi:hypothetical protein FBR05_06260 [Deltaproteobacteria bacterium PRO3]|nr:hypothetical protein [Deltaproteobacteria bacterium PRO3]